MSPENAERLTHIVWPMTLAGGFLWVFYRSTANSAGETAARLALLLAVFTPSAWYQFAVGRIDHHNAMIAATVSAALLMWSYPERKDLWRLAGVLTGLALAVGYEALAPAVALGLLATAWSFADQRAAKPTQEFARHSRQPSRSRFSRPSPHRTGWHPLRRDLAQHGGSGRV